MPRPTVGDLADHRRRTLARLNASRKRLAPAGRFEFARKRRVRCRHACVTRPCERPNPAQRRGRPGGPAGPGHRGDAAGRGGTQQLRDPSPSAPPVAIGSPSLAATVTPTESAPPSAAPTPSVEPSAAPSASATPSGSPGALALATLTFVGLKLDATADPGGEARVVTFRSDGPGTVSAKLGANSPQGKTHMCLLVGTKQIGCKDITSGTFTGKTTQAHANWTVTLEGTACQRPDRRPDRDVPGGRAEGHDRARPLRRHGFHPRRTGSTRGSALGRPARSGSLPNGAVTRSITTIELVRRERRAGDGGSRRCRARNRRPTSRRRCRSRRGTGGSCSRTPMTASGRPT